MFCFISAKIPDNSTPVGPAPAIAKESSLRRNSLSSVRVARSKRVYTKLRSIRASPTVFIGIAFSSTSLLPKKFDSAPVAITNTS